MKKSTANKLNDGFYTMLELLFRELDQDAIKLEVEGLKEKMPKASRREIAKILTRRAAIKSAVGGITAGAPGGAIGLLAMGPDIFNLVRQQSRLILSIAFLYEQEPHLEDRFKEVLGTLAISTGASVGRRGARMLIQKGLEKRASEGLMKKIAGRYFARKAPTAIGPIIGGVAGGVINFAAVRSTAKFATDYYENLFKMKSTATPPALTGEIKPAKTAKGSPRKTGGKKSGARKSGTKKAARKSSKKKPAKKSSTKKSAKKTTKKATKKRSSKKSGSKSEGQAPEAQ